jgi:hypothetical protein
MNKISLKDNNKVLSRNEMRIITGGNFMVDNGFGDSGQTTCGQGTCGGTCVLGWNSSCSCLKSDGTPASGSCKAIKSIAP